MKIVVAGGSGFIGEPLVRRLLARGYDVAVLTRDASRVAAGRPLTWDGHTQGTWSDEVSSADAIVNLAGENIAEGRWTDARKQRLIDSRLNATRAIVEALRREPSRRRVLVNASAIGFSGDRKDDSLAERSARGGGFLADLVDRWEAAAREADPLARLVVLRFGVVLAAGGGALQKMLLPFKLGAGGPIGS
ncbi:MAG TPA: NAD-dependent epimerase/dehydratase family protein, partial [Thermoanaerobaculia bacterium]|nr:NAD-dependent epimerase/dehydratase family protein [Thermoanaerobaculia bacterium]